MGTTLSPSLCVRTLLRKTDDKRLQNFPFPKQFFLLVICLVFKIFDLKMQFFLLGACLHYFVFNVKPHANSAKHQFLWIYVYIVVKTNHPGVRPYKSAAFDPVDPVEVAVSLNVSLWCCTSAQAHPSKREVARARTQTVPIGITGPRYKKQNQMTQLKFFSWHLKNKQDRLTSSRSILTALRHRPL